MSSRFFPYSYLALPLVVMDSAAASIRAVTKFS